MTLIKNKCLTLPTDYDSSQLFHQWNHFFKRQETAVNLHVGHQKYYVTSNR